MNRMITTLTIAIAVTNASYTFACGPGGCKLRSMSRSWGGKGWAGGSTYSRPTSYKAPSYQPSYSAPSYSKPSYTPPKYTPPTYTPSYSVSTPPQYSSGTTYSTSPTQGTMSTATPTYSSTQSHASTQASSTHQPVRPTAHVVAKPVHSPKQKIYIECPKDEQGECAYTLISAKGTAFDYTMTAGRTQQVEVDAGWKIKFRVTHNGPWVGYVLKPGHRYALQRNDEGNWDLYEI